MQTLVFCFLCVGLPLHGVGTEESQIENMRLELAALESREEELASELERVRNDVADILQSIQTLESEVASSQAESPGSEVLGQTVQLARSIHLKAEPDKAAREVTFLFTADMVRVNRYGPSGWWLITVLCENDRSSGDEHKPCEVSGFAHHDEMAPTLAAAGFKLPNSFLYPVGDLPEEISLGRNTGLATYPGGPSRRAAGSPAQGPWKLLAAVNPEGLSTLLVGRGGTLGWVHEFQADSVSSRLLEHHSALLTQRYSEFRNELRQDHPDLVVYEVFPERPDSAGGVDVTMALEIFGKKTVKYLTIELEPYNTVGDRVGGRLRSQPHRRLKLTGPISATDEISQVQWEAVWYNPTISCLKVARIEVEYMDGSTYTYVRELPKILYAHLADGCHDQP